MPEEMTLYEMFASIKKQQMARGIDHSALTAEQSQAYANACALALHVEVSELASSWSFAPWKTTDVDHENIKREIVDCFFFLANIAESFGITTQDLEDKFIWVLANNYKRMENGQHKEVNGAYL